MQGGLSAELITRISDILQSCQAKRCYTQRYISSYIDAPQVHCWQLRAVVAVAVAADVAVVVFYTCQAPNSVKNGSLLKRIHNNNNNVQCM